MVLLSACGGAGDTSSPATTDYATIPGTGEKNYKLVVTGDNVTFTAQIYTNTMQVVPGIGVATIAPSGNETLEATGSTASSIIIQRVSVHNGQGLRASLYVNGMLVETSPLLYYPSENYAFSTAY